MEEIALLVQNRALSLFGQVSLFAQSEKKVFLCVSLRCVYVGDPHARGKALPGSEEQWCDWADRERWAAPNASKLPSHPLQPYDQVLGLRPQQETQVYWT